MEVRLRWAGHVVWMGEERLSRDLLKSELSDGTSPLGAPKKHFKDQLKNSLAKCGISDFETLARDKTKWRTAVKADVVKLEDCRIEELKERRRCRKAQISAPGCYPSDTCPKTCPKVSGSAIGLVSHHRAHDHKGDRQYCFKCGSVALRQPNQTS